MTDSILTGGEWTALTILHWTSDPFQKGRQQWLMNALTTLSCAGYAEKTEIGDWFLTDKGRCLMDAVLALPEPVNKWVMPC